MLLNNDGYHISLYFSKYCTKSALSMKLDNFLENSYHLSKFSLIQVICFMHCMQVEFWLMMIFLSKFRF
jgi:hypothetical protein